MFTYFRKGPRFRGDILILIKLAILTPRCYLHHLVKLFSVIDTAEASTAVSLTPRIVLSEMF